MSQVREVFIGGRKNESTNVRFTHNCTRFFKSEAYFHTIELKNMSSRDPKLSGYTQKRLIHFDLMIGREARETERDESILEAGAKLLNPCGNL